MVLLVGTMVIGMLLCVWSTSMSIITWASLQTARVYIVPRAGFTLSDLFVLPKRLIQGVLKGKTTTKGIAAVTTLVSARFANVRVTPSPSVPFSAMRKLSKRWQARLDQNWTAAASLAPAATDPSTGERATSRSLKAWPAIEAELRLPKTLIRAAIDAHKAISTEGQSHLARPGPAGTSSGTTAGASIALSVAWGARVELVRGLVRAGVSGLEAARRQERGTGSEGGASGLVGACALKEWRPDLRSRLAIPAHDNRSAAVSTSALPPKPCLVDSIVDHAASWKCGDDMGSGVGGGSSSGFELAYTYAGANATAPTAAGALGS